MRQMLVGLGDVSERDYRRNARPTVPERTHATVTRLSNFEFSIKARKEAWGVVYPRAGRISLDELSRAQDDRGSRVTLLVKRVAGASMPEGPSGGQSSTTRISSYYEVGEHDGQHYFNHKWIDGQSVLLRRCFVLGVHLADRKTPLPG